MSARTTAIRRCMRGSRAQDPTGVEPAREPSAFGYARSSWPAISSCSTRGSRAIARPRGRCSIATCTRSIASSTTSSTAASRTSCRTRSSPASRRAIRFPPRLELSHRTRSAWRGTCCGSTSRSADVRPKQFDPERSSLHEIRSVAEHDCREKGRASALRSEALRHLPLENADPARALSLRGADGD